MYYLLETDFFTEPTAYRTELLSDEFHFLPSRWLTGKLMQEPKKILKVEFFQNGGKGLAEILLDSIPLFSKALVDALHEAGVDNLQLFPVEIVERDGSLVNQEYCAVNIIGCVQCADIDKSELTDLTGNGLTAVSFRKLAIDELKANNLYLFRLAESVASIVVHAHVKALLDAKGFKYVTYRPLTG